MMMKNSKEVELDNLKIKCSDLIYDVAQMRNDYSQQCTNYYSKILKMEHKQLKNTVAIIPKTSSTKITSKYSSKPFDQFPLNENTSVDNNDLMQKLDSWLEEKRDFEEIAAVIDK